MSIPLQLLAYACENITARMQLMYVHLIKIGYTQKLAN